jgi:hypothetical protein
MGESAEGKGLGRVWEGLSEDRRVVGDVGGWGGFGGIWVGGRQIRLGDRLVRGLSFKPWIRPYQSSTNLEQTLKKDLLFHSWFDQGVKTSFSMALEISYKPLLGSYMISYLTPLPLPPLDSMKKPL